MSNFNGCFEELENILVDNFRLYENHTCFFLSHCHSDHMNGIVDLFSNIEKNADQYLYCSPVSRLILISKYKINKAVIKELTSTTVIKVPESTDFPSYQVTVTPIPAGHCPGSVMFLFETLNKTVLYTGDFRILKNDIAKFKSLHVTNAVKSIDNLYFDSTFLNEEYWEFPLRSEVALKLQTVIEDWLRQSPDHNVMLETCASYGYEFIFVEIASLLKNKIHVKESVFDLYWNVPEVGSVLTKDCKSTKIHAFYLFDKKCCPSKSKGNLLRIKLSAQWYRSKKNGIRKPFWKKISKQKMIMCYSTHSSCSELVDFLNYLKPRGVKACTSTVKLSEADKETYIQRLMSHWPEEKAEEKESNHSDNPDLKLEKNYKFRLKFPKIEASDDFLDFLPERKKQLLCNGNI